MSGARHMHPRSTGLRDRAVICIWAAVGVTLLAVPALAREGVPQAVFTVLADVPDVDDVWGEPYTSGGGVGPARDFRVLIEVDHARRSRGGEQPKDPGR